MIVTFAPALTSFFLEHRLKQFALFLLPVLLLSLSAAAQTDTYAGSGDIPGMKTWEINYQARKLVKKHLSTDKKIETLSDSSFTVRAVLRPGKKFRKGLPGGTKIHLIYTLSFAASPGHYTYTCTGFTAYTREPGKKTDTAQPIDKLPELTLQGQPLPRYCQPERISVSL